MAKSTSPGLSDTTFFARWLAHMIDFSCLLLLFYFCIAGLPKVSRGFFLCAAIEFVGDASGLVGGRHVFELHEYVSGTQGRQESQKLQNYC